jgi:hypothetical protein
MSMLNQLLCLNVQAMNSTDATLRVLTTVKCIKFCIFLVVFQIYACFRCSQKLTLNLFISLENLGIF